MEFDAGYEADRLEFLAHRFLDEHDIAERSQIGHRFLDEAYSLNQPQQLAVAQELLRKYGNHSLDSLLNDLPVPELSFDHGGHVVGMSFRPSRWDFRGSGRLNVSGYVGPAGYYF